MDPTFYAGFAAGLVTSLLWALTSLCFAAGGRRIGPTLVNGLRLYVAILLLTGMVWITTGEPWPVLSDRQFILLAASSLVGIVIGDQALFTAFVDIGPRLSLLMMSTAPIWAAVLGWLVLGESLAWPALVGIAVTIAGVAWVIMERPTMKADERAHPHRVRGIVLALVGSMCQGGGLLISKAGMGHGWLEPEDHLGPLPATQVRIAVAIVCMTPVLIARWRFQAGRNAPKIPPRTLKIGLAFTALGAFVGPFLGMWMSLVTADLTPVAVAQTLCSLAPVMILPMVAWSGDRVSPRAVLGACVAVGGVAILALLPAILPESWTKSGPARESEASPALDGG
ncbi:MAG: DMT family transporter [Phycisphaerales bacterium]